MSSAKPPCCFAWPAWKLSFARIRKTPRMPQQMFRAQPHDGSSICCSTSPLAGEPFSCQSKQGKQQAARDEACANTGGQRRAPMEVV